MSQITHGIRSILSHPKVYDLLQDVMGAKHARRTIVREFIRPAAGMRILDVGCGTAEIRAFLPDNITYVGYDISAAYIEAAEKNFSGRGTFRCRLLDAQEAATLEPFDLVMSIGVLHHLNDDEARDFMRVARTLLKPSGKVLTRDPCYAQGQNPIARFLISRDRGQNVRTQAGYEALAESDAQVTGVLTHQAWVPYTHWTMECR